MNWFLYDRDLLVKRVKVFFVKPSLECSSAKAKQDFLFHGVKMNLLSNTSVFLSLKDN